MPSFKHLSFPYLAYNIFKNCFIEFASVMLELVIAAINILNHKQYRVNQSGKQTTLSIYSIAQVRLMFYAILPVFFKLNAFHFSN
ncbi:UNKNOWN [Stylonychia lemnae]|uniref:Uncharacterized protein n=1 Tax=Stylonychia lemnae TaxID=5949 RepID=A0A078B9N2_STYLE|nr:UNKNOWN [Stylonychia lemnae]|eukprot:CDW91245.1 UNKNOWN [Stylonychia lemnae]